MNTHTTGYQQLIQKLNRFIQKYYANQLIRGSLIFLGVNLLLFVAFNVMESQFYFSSGVRKVLFYSGALVFLATFLAWVALPLIQIFKLGKTISHDDAARIIGDHFPEVRDKLLNTLQLARQSGDAVDQDLLMHSIKQKTDEIKLVSFPKAIDLRQNRKYLKYALPPLLLLLVLLFSAPSVITDSSYRLFHNNREFERQAPFSFYLENTNLSLPQFEDIEIRMSTMGDVQPQEAYITVDNFQYKMKKDEQGYFHYTLNNVANNTDFYFTANGFSSSHYEIVVFKKPSLARMTVDLDFPAYTGIEDKTVLNEGDFVIPAGTRISWTFDTDNMSQLGLTFGGGMDTLLDAQNNLASYTQRIYSNTDYKLVFNSPDIPKADSVRYFIEAIPDQFPKINLQSRTDSVNQKINYIVGEASDDYGIQKITFNYAVVSQDQDPDQQVEFQSQLLKNVTGKAATYDKIVDVSEYNLVPGASLWYYFEVFDNDGINGSKSSKTPIQRWTQKTIAEFEELEAQTEEDIKSNLDEILKEQQNLIKTTEELRNKLLQDKELTWQRKKEIEQLLESQEAIQQKLQETQQLHQQNQQNKQEYKNSDPQNDQEIQKMMEQARNPELEQLLNKIKELMDKMEREDAIKEMENLSRQMNQSEMDITRLEELYKKLEMESNLMDQMQKLQDLAEEQKKLAEENLSEDQNAEDSQSSESESESSEDQSSEENDENGDDQSGENQSEDESLKNEEGGSEDQDNENSQNQGQEQNSESQNQNNSSQSPEERMQQQQQINEAFDKISQDLQELFEKNKQLKQPVNMDDPKTPSEEIKRDLNQSMQEMQSGSPQQAGEKQQQAGEKMEQMAQSMQQQMQSGQQEQMQEDIKALRQILENLVKLSFDQEDLVDEVANISYATPQYVDKVRKQFDLNNDFKLIQDSLLALANRNAQIEGTITEKVNLINEHMAKSLNLMEEQEKNDAANDQRRTMKNVNDLALMLTESLQNMQMQMASPASMCQNPGNSSGSVPMDKITEGQKQVTEEMKNMARKRQEGQGQDGQSSKDFAQIAAQQAAMRKMLQEKQQQLMEQGKGSKQLQELIDMMDQTETDLVNKQLTNEMLERQQEILTRLLEAEKAERQQEMDEQRRSEEAKNIAKTLPPDLQEYLNQRREEITPYQKLSPALKPYYKRLVEEYYDELKNR